MAEEIKGNFDEKFPINEDMLIAETLETTFMNPSMGFQCENFYFTAKSKSGLKTHTKKKHKLQEQ